MSAIEGWSPGTLVRYGFCRVDSHGDVVSIWNFRELDEALNGIDSDSDQDDVVGLTVDGHAAITDTNVGFDVAEGESTLVLAPPPVADDDLVWKCEVCQYVQSPPNITEDDVGNFEVNVHSCPVCVFNYRKYVEDFYADMPGLLPPDASDYLRFGLGLPALESPCDTFGRADAVTRKVDTFFISGFTRLSRVCGMVAKFVLLQLVCQVYEVPSPVFTKSLDILLYVCLLEFE